MDTDVDLIREMENASIETHAALLRFDAALGEIRLREAGLKEIGASMFVGPVRPVDGEVSEESFRVFQDALMEAAVAEGFGVVNFGKAQSNGVTS